MFNALNIRAWNGIEHERESMFTVPITMVIRRVPYDCVTLIASALTLVLGCGQREEQTSSLAGQYDSPEQFVDEEKLSNVTTEESTSREGARSDRNELDASKYVLELTCAKIELSAREASRAEFLSSLSNEVGFNLELEIEVDQLATMHFPRVVLVRLLDELLADVAYEVAFRATPGDSP